MGGVVGDKQKVAISQLSWRKAGRRRLPCAPLRQLLFFCNLYLRGLQRRSQAIFPELLWENKQRLPRRSAENIILIFDTKLSQGPFCGGFSLHQAWLV